MFLCKGLLSFSLIFLLLHYGKAQTENQTSIEKTAFYTLKVMYDSVKHQTRYAVKSITIIDKATKAQSNLRYEQSPDYLKITVIDKLKHNYNVVTEHPLYKHVELFSESGEIESKSVSLPQGEVTFRIPYYTAFKKIKITEVKNFKKQKTVIIKHEK